MAVRAPISNLPPRPVHVGVVQNEPGETKNDRVDGGGDEVKRNRLVITRGEETKLGSAVGNCGERLPTKTSGMKGSVQGNGELPSDLNIQKIFVSDRIY